MAQMSLTELARIPTAPACLAASAILAIMWEPCKGSFSKAWQETISPPDTAFKKLFVIKIPPKLELPSV